jgi:hypothetical protein
MLTVWCPTTAISVPQCDAKNTEHQVKIITFYGLLRADPFKLCSAETPTGHLILVAKGSFETRVIGAGP